MLFSIRRKGSAFLPDFETLNPGAFELTQRPQDSKAPSYKEANRSSTRSNSRAGR